MSSVPEALAVAAARLPLVAGADLLCPLLWHDGRAMTAAEFLGQVVTLAARLPAGAAVVNLCEDRQRFLVTFAAALLRGQANLLPPARTPTAVAEVLTAHAGSHVCVDAASAAWPDAFVVDLPQASPVDTVPTIPAEQVALVGYTSGSTGTPHANAKTWRALQLSNAHNDAMLRRATGDAYHVVATVPSQHMYGIETTVLLPLLGHAAVATGRPFFPADIAAALARIPTPRVLVTTPLHLRQLLASDLDLPLLASIVTATAPLPVAIARAAEARWATRVDEVFGSTETCVIAHRRTACETDWHLYDGIELAPRPDGVEVGGPRFAAPVTLADIVELDATGRRFRLCGRNADLLEIAGKRASLADLTERLLALDGVEDGVVLQLDADAQGVRRIAALAVAPGRRARDLVAELRRVVDPVFLPRPLKLVAALPRNATDKLPRAAALALLRGDGKSLTQ